MRERIAPIAERELGAAPDAVSRVEEGLLHETFELRCGGTGYILQFAGADREDALERGLYWYRLLRDSEVPVPPVVTPESREFEGRPYILVETLPGTTGERDVSPGRTVNAGRCLATLHGAVDFDATGDPSVDTDTPPTSGFDWGREQRGHDIEHSASVLRDGGLDRAGTELERLFGQSEGRPSNEFQPVLCHGDFSPDNVLFRGSEVTGVLDFDRSHPGHSHRDLVRAANAFWMHDPCSDWGVRATFYDGYREVRALGSSFERTEPLYRAETLAETVAGLLELGELSEYERSFYAERLSDAIERVD